MADALKKDIALKFLTPMVLAYAAVAASLSIDPPFIVDAPPLHAAASAGIAGLFGLVLEEIVPRSIKEIIVFWRRTERPPGFRAFSKVAPADARVDQAKLAALLPQGALAGSQQNTIWYGWLKELESDSGIAQNHRNLLILRDATVLACVLTLLTFIWLFFALSDWRAILTLEAICLCSYGVLMLSARHSAERLVGNVIALKVARTT